MSFGRKIVSVITLAFAMITLTTFAAAQDTGADQTQKQKKFERKGERGFGRGMRGGRHAEFGLRGLHRLNLTDAQKTQIRSLMEANKTANEPFRQEMRTIFEKRRSGGELTDSDRARLQEIQTRMRQSAEQNQNTILSILTVEQRQQLEQWKQERQKQKEERRQRMQERRQEREKQRTQQTTRTDG